MLNLFTFLCLHLEVRQEDHLLHTWKMTIPRVYYNFRHKFHFGGFLMSNTIDNLKTAFAGESQAFQKYTAYAKKAAADGLPNIAKLFETTAQAELTHAAGHLKALDKIQTTLDNLQDAIDGETYEFTEMYPPMLEEATSVNHRARVMFGYAVAAEEVHANLYKKALLGTRPERCPICNMKGEKFLHYQA